MTMSLTPRRAIACAAVACAAVLAAVLAAGCGSAASPTPTVTVTASPPASGGPGSTSAPPTSAPPSTPGQPTSPAGPQACATRDLKVKLGLGQGAMGSVYTNLDFTNIGTTTCTLYGYPGVSLAGGTPVAQIGLAAAEDRGTPRQLVTLAPGAVANALLRIMHAQLYSASRCHPVTATYLQIFPPNQTTPVYLAYSATACAKPIRLMTIDAVRPGSGG